LLEVEAVSELPEHFGAWTAAGVKTHNYGRDFSALQKLLPLGLRYLGLIGPKSRRDQLLVDLFETAEPINAELLAPTGLDLGAETPEEIALAIVAEIQSIFTAASCESLRNRKAPIHAIGYLQANETNTLVSTR
jgi:xanthine dehydrogenase accessory factor